MVRFGFVSSFQQVLHIAVCTPKGKYQSCFKPDFHINTWFRVQMNGGKMCLSISQALRLSQALLCSFIGIKSGHELKTPYNCHFAIQMLALVSMEDGRLPPHSSIPIHFVNKPIESNRGNAPFDTSGDTGVPL